MSTYLSKDITVTVGDNILIHESRIVINEGDKICVIGENGVGKTTLINQIKDLVNVDYLLIDQHVEIEDNESCFEFIIKSKRELYETEKKLTSMYEEIENKEETDESEMEQINEYETTLNVNGWGKFKADAMKILSGLQFTNPERKTYELSGGWRIRLALGRALLNKPSILFLDEPTNHLDLEANIWLNDYLLEYTKTIVICTHDRDLIENVATRYWYVANLELTGVKVYSIAASLRSLGKFIKQKNKEVADAYKSYENRLKAFRCQKPSPSKSQVEEFIRKNTVPRPPKPYDVNIEWCQVEKSSRQIVRFDNISFSYDDNKIFDRLNFSIFGDSRYVLVGRNGAGKTTFLKLCIGDLDYNHDGESTIYRDPRIKIGYYNQQIIEDLPLDLTPIQYLKSLDDRLTVGECKAILGRLSLKKMDFGDPTSIPIRNLSGGQKARVAFARLQISSPSLYLFDEPTNHLDVETIEALIQSLNEFNGAVVVITHSMHLIRSLNKGEIFIADNQTITHFKGDIDAYRNYVTNKA